MNKTGFTRLFRQFIDSSPSVFHAAANVKAALEEKGFTQLAENQPWKLEAGGRYLLSRNDSAVIAFTLPKKFKARGAFRFVTSHLDSPAPRIKFRGLREAAGQAMLPIEIYGGTILNTWLDRPLGIAGRCMDAKTGVFTLFRHDHAAVIPNLAIHLNRSCNEGVALNPQNDMEAIVGGKESLDTLKKQMPFLADEPTAAELFLYDDTPASILGMDNSIIQAPRLDNLSSAFAALIALAEGGDSPETCLSFFADNEEIGSRTPQGADSSFLRTAITRITLALGGTLEESYIALANSSLISADAAHALHPCHPAKHDKNYAPVMGNGVALKSNVSGRYCTNGPMLQKTLQLAKASKIPVQHFTNRADMPCGSTVGPTTAADLGIPGIDLGIPMLAMHSARETAAMEDIWQLYRLMAAFYARA